MEKRDLLPGVDPDGYEPKVLCDSRKIIRRARRIALLRDAAQLLIVAVVDAFFVRWPLARVPFLGRDESLFIVLAFNAIVVFHVIASRKLPLWRSRRVASTWCPAERKRFSTSAPGEPQ